MFANLAGANFFRSDLSLANLKYADLTGTNLAEVDLVQADLRHANLTNANLDNTNLGGAILQDTRGLSRAQLSNARAVDESSLPDYLRNERRTLRD